MGPKRFQCEIRLAARLQHPQGHGESRSSRSNSRFERARARSWPLFTGCAKPLHASFHAICTEIPGPEAPPIFTFANRPAREPARQCQVLTSFRPLARCFPARAEFFPVPPPLFHRCFPAQGPSEGQDSDRSPLIPPLSLGFSDGFLAGFMTFSTIV